MVINLGLAEFFQGFLSLIFVIVSIFVGLKCISRYFKQKNLVFLLFGLIYILILEPWWPIAISFSKILTTGEGLSLQEFLFYGHALIPVSLIIGVFFFTELAYKKYQKKLLILTITLSIVFEILFLYFLITAPTSIAEFNNPIDISYKLNIWFFLLFGLILIFIGGLVLGRESMKIEEEDFKLKGKLIMAGFSLFTIGTILEISLPLNLITLIITWIILALMILTLNGGLPEWMREFSVKERLLLISLTVFLLYFYFIIYLIHNGSEIGLPFEIGFDIKTLALMFNIGIPIVYFVNFFFMLSKLGKLDKDAPFYPFIKSLVWFFLFYGIGALYFVWYDFFYMEFKFIKV